MLKRHPYILTILLTTVVSLVAWSFVPKRYGAQTKLVDEYKELDLAIGMNSMSAAIRDAMQKGNEGINDIEVYSKMLATEDFARELSHKQVPGKGMTYGQYLADCDTIETILDNLSYNLSTKQQTVTIQVEDRNPLVAAQMLDSATVMLQNAVTTRRHDMALAMLSNAEAEMQKSKQAYQNAQDAYAAYQDSHLEGTLEQEKTEATKLREDAELTYKRYQDATEQYARQKSLAVRSYSSFAVSKANSVPTKDNHHPIGYTIFAVALALLVVRAVKLLLQRRHKGVRTDYGDVFSPWSITIGIWALNLLLYFSQGGTMYPILPSFWKAISIWLPLFVTTSFVACNLSTNGNKYEGKPIALRVNMTVYNALWCVSMCLSPLYLYRVMSIVTQFDTANLLYNIRMLALSGQGGSLILNSVQAINVALFATSIWLYPKVSKLRIVTVVAAYLTVQFAMMEKSGILVMILSTLFVLHQKQKIKLRTIGVILSCTVVLFFLINVSLQEKNQEDTQFIDFFGMYVTSPAVAFGYLKEYIGGTQFGLNTFSQVYQYLNAFGFNFDYTERLQEFVYVPIPTNVYTIFQPMYEDFGLFGIGVFAIFYGALFGWIYGRYRSGSSYFCLLYTYSVEILIIQFYNENLLQNLFLSVGFAFWTFVLAQQTIVFVKKQEIKCLK